jgi:hypothetical protein
MGNRLQWLRRSAPVIGGIIYYGSVDRPELSQLYHREGFPPAAGGRAHEAVPLKLRAKTDDPRRTQNSRLHHSPQSPSQSLASAILRVCTD